MREAGLDDTAIAKTFELLAVTSLEGAEALAGADSPALANLRDLFALAERMGYGDLLQFDISVIRGLSYYTGIVFEAFDVQRRFRAIFGGGRYDSLLALVGGKPTPAVGMGFGDVVVGEVLREVLGDACPVTRRGYAIGYMDEAQRPAAIGLAAKLRAEGHPVDLSLVAQKPKHFFSKAGASAAKYAVFLGPDDIAAGTAQAKDLDTREATPLALV